MTRDLGAEVDALKRQMEELLQLVQGGFFSVVPQRPAARPEEEKMTLAVEPDGSVENGGAVFYSGHYRNRDSRFRWEPQERSLETLVNLQGEKAAKVLAALGQKQRLEILLEVLKEPVSGPELVERLHMGTTGQLYHHLKALLSADLIRQEERGGRYMLAQERSLPLLLLLAAVSDLLETSSYLDMAEARTHAEQYVGEASDEGFDPHLLLWAAVENSILEHRAGYCTAMHIILHEDGSVTVSDNGRGIPVQALPQTDRPAVQDVLTDIHRLSGHYVAPGGEKGISIAVVNALSSRLTVEIRREGRIYRQEYRNGIPQTGLWVIGATKETGTSVTFKPSGELFRTGFYRKELEDRLAAVRANDPGLNVVLETGGAGSAR
ncbi:ATP-binding protein [Paenibacillus filicis]|uniref:DNA topoisomerase (ATP-hydrolyzing) n=1 Tax=Paenibacillus gyeongsangnamensis TaxID=3388067 RepID=A0ABT4Q5X4_9BACL|nr:ATP-binding protein [Paenibacillus filicis]MCZ8512265.1 ATP-binding protein [Paenibacillus filicis]